MYGVILAVDVYSSISSFPLVTDLALDGRQTKETYYNTWKGS